MTNLQLASSDWILVVALALPHLLYAFIWFFPHLWMRAFKKSSVETFELLAWTLKGKPSSKLPFITDLSSQPSDPFFRSPAILDYSILVSFEEA